MSDREFQRLKECGNWEKVTFSDLKVYDGFRFRDNPSQPWDEIEFAWVVRSNPIGHGDDTQIRCDPCSNGKPWELQMDIKCARRKDELEVEYLASGEK